jgi:predicted amidohydrolase YtcJ
MSPSRASATTVVSGQVLLAAGSGGLQTAEALGLAAGRVVSAGSRADVLGAAAAGAQLIDVGSAAVVPGLHDFHLHLVGMARARSEVNLDDAIDFETVLRKVDAGAGRLRPDAWLRGRGWREAALSMGELERLDDATGHRPALIYSHDGHSAWASSVALRRAGVDVATPDPPGGRLERGADGSPNGILRERATDLLEPVAGRVLGEELVRALQDTVADLAALGITGAVDAGDPTADSGVGEYAALGDRAAALLAAGERLDGRIRLTVNLPAEAIEAAATLGLHSGQLLDGTSTVRVGWAKAFVDGALGSRTAALFAPYSCGSPGETGITRLTDSELDAILAAGRAARIALAIHAIGDRAVASVLDAIDRSPPRAADMAPDRIEHLQLVRPADVARLAANDLTASLQPIHCASDRPLVDACWADRAGQAYPWRSLLSAGTRLAFGSDAPIESVNPWLGIFAALHRRHPGDGTADWHPEQALDIGAAIGGYTVGPAAAAGRADEGHLRPGAHADLAVLNVDLAGLLRGDEALSTVRSELTLVAGVEVHRS